MRALLKLLCLMTAVATAAEPAAGPDSISPRSAAAASAPRPQRASALVNAPADSTVAQPDTSGVRPTPDSPACADCAPGQQHLQGERSRLESEKQLLTLRVDIATLHRKLQELESEPRSVPVGVSLPVVPAEPLPTVLSRRGFDGHFAAILRMSGGGRVVVHAGDRLPNGKVDSVDSQGVTVTWYGRHLRLLDTDGEEEGGASTAAHNLDLNLPAPPPAVSGR
jgi:type IV pilus biogenesis protein PilP